MSYFVLDDRHGMAGTGACGLTSLITIRLSCETGEWLASRRVGESRAAGLVEKLHKENHE